MGRLLACLGAAASTALLLSIASCGSRTGLFGPEGIGLLPDGGLPDAEPDAPGPVPCRPGRFDLQLARAQLMFVLDRSGSMAFYLSSDIEAKPPLRRWDYLREALETTIVPLDSQIAMGAKSSRSP